MMPMRFWALTVLLVGSLVTVFAPDLVVRFLAGFGVGWVARELWREGL